MAPKIRFSDRVTWIVYKYGELKSISLVTGAFRLHFHPTSHRLMPSRCAFVCHTTENNLSFLKQKFSGRLISNKSEVPWPPSSPECNPLDFFLSGYVLQHIYRIKPTLIADLKAAVEDFVESIDPAIIRKSCASARKRFEMMMLENGGRFEHKMTALKPLMDGVN